MTSITASRQATRVGTPARVGRLAQLTLALLVGLAIGSALTFQIARGDATADSNGQASRVGGVSTTASEQYADWYLRPSSLAGSTTASEQYRAWYMRNSGAR